MHLMTKSQLNHYAHDCKKLKIVPTELESNIVTLTLDQFFTPFNISLQNHYLEIEIITNFKMKDSDILHDLNKLEDSKKFITDWSIYKEILFHLV